MKSLTSFYAGDLDGAGGFTFGFAENPDGTGVSRIVSLDTEDDGAAVDYCLSTQTGATEYSCGLRMTVDLTGRRLTLEVARGCARGLGIPVSERFAIDDSVPLSEVAGFCLAVQVGMRGTDAEIVMAGTAPGDEAPPRKAGGVPVGADRRWTAEIGFSGPAGEQHTRELERYLRQQLAGYAVQVQPVQQSRYSTEPVVSLAFDPSVVGPLSRHIAEWGKANVQDGMLLTFSPMGAARMATQANKLAETIEYSLELDNAT